MNNLFAFFLTIFPVLIYAQHDSIHVKADKLSLLPAMVFEEGETEMLPSGDQQILVMRYMMGEIPVGDSIYHEFKVKNLGSSPLIFTNVVPDCECAVTYFTEGEIQPGQYGIIAAGFRMKEVGKMRHILTILSNMPSGSDFIEIYAEGIEKK